MRRSSSLIRKVLCGACVVGSAVGTGAEAQAPAASPAVPTAIALWQRGASAFGIFVPSERAPGAVDAAGKRLPPLYTAAGARALAGNPLLDFLFLNLEGGYDPEAVRAMVAGVNGSEAPTRPTLLVRIPTIEDAGAEVTRQRVKEVLAMGAGGVVVPHVRSADEARLAVSFFRDAGANVWSPANPTGSVVAMLMVEDRGAIAAMRDIASVPGYSLLSCGIGSLTRDMGGDAAGAESACQQVRDLAQAAKMPSMMTAAASSIRDRIDRGYLGLLMSGTVEQAAAVIRTGREIAGRR